jgi:hypothetical protein
MNAYTPHTSARRTDPGTSHEAAQAAAGLEGFVSIYQRYEIEKRAWVNAHPEATPEQIEQAFRAIARRLGV